MQADRRNMERMEEHVPESDYEALQNFISNSPWDARSVINRVATESDALLGGTGRTVLLIDETAISKKDECSVGVSRQWNGRLGKTELFKGIHFLPRKALCADIFTGILTDMK